MPIKGAIVVYAKSGEWNINRYRAYARYLFFYSQNHGTMCNMNDTKPLPGSSVVTKVAGVTYHKDVSLSVEVGDAVVAYPDGENAADPSAVVIKVADDRVLGYIPANTDLRKRLLVTGTGPWVGVVCEILEPAQSGHTRGVQVKLNLNSTPSTVTEEKQTENLVQVLSPGPVSRVLGVANDTNQDILLVKPETGPLRAYPRHLVTIVPLGD